MNNKIWWKGIENEREIHEEKSSQVFVSVDPLTLKPTHPCRWKSWGVFAGFLVASFMIDCPQNLIKKYPKKYFS